MTEIESLARDGREELHPDNPEAMGYLERSLASSPVWQMGARTLERQVVRRDPRLLDFLANAKNALREADFPVIDERIPFPGSGQQLRFAAAFQRALNASPAPH